MPLTSRFVRFRFPVITILLMIILLLLVVILAQHEKNVQSQNDIVQAQNQLQAVNDCRTYTDWIPDTTTRFTVQTSDGGERGFLVHTPSDFKTNKKYPVVIGLTGKGASAEGFEQAFGLDTLPALTVYPEATLGEDGVSAWQGAPYSSGVNDVKFISQVIDKVEGTFCVSKNKIHVVGMSNGGGMAWLLSCQLSNRVASFAMIAGAFYYPDQPCSPQRPSAVLSIHGDQDLSVPYYGSTTRELPSIPTWAAHKAALNGCSSQPSVVTLPYATETTTWMNCRSNSTVKSIRLLGLGHVWPDSITTARHPIDKTTSILWDFFSQHSLQ